MWTALWTILKGNPTSWLWIGAGVALIALVSFGGGYYSAVSQVEHIQVAAAGKAAVAQEKHDVQEHKDAVVVSDNVAKNDAAHDAKLQVIVKKIHDAEGVPVNVSVDMPTITLSPPQNSCDLSPEVAKLLNDAGHYKSVE